MAKDGDERLYARAEVERMIAPLLERIAELEAEIARLTRCSRTSSKPPSGDVVKLGPKGRLSKRKPGGQQGHRMHRRELLPAERVDGVNRYELADTAGLRPLTGDGAFGSFSRSNWWISPAGSASARRVGTCRCRPDASSRRRCPTT